MSKYETMNSNVETIDIKSILVEGENIIWQGVPKKSAFILNKMMTMFPIALVWLLFDGGFITMFLSTGAFKQMFWFIIPFFALHLMPVWIWLGNILTASKKWENTKYILTDKRIIIESGFIGMNYHTIYYRDINKVNLKVGVVDKLLNVGDIYFTVNDGTNQAFLDIKDVYNVYARIQKIVLDIQTDIEFPNKLRPDENPGYNTKYTGKF